MSSVIKAGRKGLTFYEPTRTFDGYNLFCPIGSNEALLMDMEGRYVHRWHLPYSPGNHGILLPDGHYLYTGKFKTSEELGYGWTAEFAGLGGIIMELDWEGNPVWQAEAPLQSHDFAVTDDGHIIYSAWELKGILPDDVAARLKGGVPGTELNGKIWGDVVVEIDRNGNRIWEWIAYEHLDPIIDATCPLENRSQWPLINAIWICRDGNLLLSLRNPCEVVKIDYRHRTGKVIGRYGRGRIFHQHDCQELEGGNILLLDNGAHRHEYGAEYSRAIEIDPETDRLAWEYKANPPSDFYSAHSSGCERQPNGNTVIIESDKGRIFEVTYDCEIVWEYVNPRYVDFLGRLSNMIWRVHRYGADYPGLKGRKLDPGKLAWMNRIWGPDALPGDVKPCLF